MNLKIFLFFVSVSTSLTSGEDCSTLNGIWYNELGSTMNVKHSHDGLLIGEYKTLVEGENGSAGGNYSYLNGVAPYNKPDTVFGFSVMWKNGSSMTSWTGQCFVCDGIEILKTSWILKVKVNSCVDIWKSTLIGQNFFTRTEWDAQQLSKRHKRDVPEVNFKNETQELLNNTDAINNTSTKSCSDISGTWYNQADSRMTINKQNGNEIKGEYITAVEACDGAAGPEDSQPMHGTSNYLDTSSTVSLFVLWNGGESITGWAGQCHVCTDDGVERLVLTWLLRSKVATCGDNWISTNYGESVFTREPQKATLKKVFADNKIGQDSPRAVCSARMIKQEILSVLLTTLLLVDGIMKL